MIGPSVEPVRPQTLRLATRSVLFFSFHYPPDQSAGAVRTSALVHQIVRLDPSIQVTVFCSVPRRYGLKAELVALNTKESGQIEFVVFGFSLGRVLSPQSCHVFYLFQAVPAAILLRPTIIVGTSAKLLTSLWQPVLPALRMLICI